jgi:hypothetical protein
MGAKKNFLRWVVVGFEMCLPTPPYIYFWNSPKLFYLFLSFFFFCKNRLWKMQLIIGIEEPKTMNNRLSATIVPSLMYITLSIFEFSGLPFLSQTHLMSTTFYLCLENFQSSNLEMDARIHWEIGWWVCTKSRKGSSPLIVPVYCGQLSLGNTANTVSFAYIVNNIESK